MATCRLCGHAPLQPFARRHDLALSRCRRCRFVSGEPSTEEALAERYRACYDAEQPATPDVRYNEWLESAEARAGKGRLLEVGAGSGGFVRAALSRGWSVDATEVSTSGLERLRATGARVLAGDVKELALVAGGYDLVASFEVIEHLEDPGGHLRELARITRSGGLLLLTTPNFDGLSRRLFGTRWRVVDPEHLGYFGVGTLRRALREAGFAQATVTARSLDVTTWRATLSHGAEQRFDPQSAAATRDRIQGSWLLRSAKDVVNGALGWTRLGDSLLAWAVR